MRQSLDFIKRTAQQMRLNSLSPKQKQEQKVEQKQQESNPQDEKDLIAALESAQQE